MQYILGSAWISLWFLRMLVLFSCQHPSAVEVSEGHPGLASLQKPGDGFTLQYPLCTPDGVRSLAAVREQQKHIWPAFQRWSFKGKPEAFRGANLPPERRSWSVFLHSLSFGSLLGSHRKQGSWIMTPASLDSLRYRSSLIGRVCPNSLWCAPTSELFPLEILWSGFALHLCVLVG